MPLACDQGGTYKVNGMEKEDEKQNVNGLLEYKIARGIAMFSASWVSAFKLYRRGNTLAFLENDSNFAIFYGSFIVSGNRTYILF